MRRAPSNKTRRPASRARSTGITANLMTAQVVDGSYYEQCDPARLPVSTLWKVAERASMLFQNVQSDRRAKLSDLSTADAA